MHNQQVYLSSWCFTAMGGLILTFIIYAELNLLAEEEVKATTGWHAIISYCLEKIYVILHVTY